MELELWPEAELRVQDAYIEGSAVKKLDLNGFGSSIHTDAPDLDARFTSVVGGMVLRLTNHTDQPKTMTLDVTQYWDEGVSVLTGTDAPEDGQQEDPVFGLLSQVQNSCYTGYDVSGLEVELAPGESRVLYWGQPRQGVWPTASPPRTASWRTGWRPSIRTARGTRSPSHWSGRCIWIELKTDPRGPVRRLGLLLPLSGHQP